MMETDSFKFIASTWLFVRALVKLSVGYYNESDKKHIVEPAGVGLTKQDRLPKDVPSITEIKDALPKRCFESSVRTSLYYALRDIVLVAATLVVGVWLQQLPWAPLRAAAMLLYWAVQGTFFTAVFVVGHDCGHGSFSKYSLLNDAVGTIFHGFLLCPFYMWKLTHRQHHRFNANLDQDEVFYPVRKSSPNADGKVLPGFGFGAGWYGYLLLGYSPRNVCHLTLSHPLFSGHAVGCFCSLVGIAAMSSVLYACYSAYGFLAVFAYYLVPQFIFASYCVVITFLHHNEMNVPWYSDDKWDFVRGQLSSVDRHYGIVHDVIHNIGTHQIHHLFARVPHYHLEEATRRFREVFPHLVKRCDEPIVTSFHRMFRVYSEQGIIADDTSIYCYE